LAWLEQLAGLLKVADVKELDPGLPLFMSRVRNPDGTRRAIARETAWRIIKAIAREHELPGVVGTHSTRKTLARKAMAWAKDIRVVQKLLGHKRLQSTEAYLKSLTDREVWSAFQTAMVAA
jgi:site-specific recombinase XerD